MEDNFEAPREYTPEPTVESVIDERVKMNRLAFAAVRTFRRSKAWSGTFDERLAKFTALAAGLSDAYGIEPGVTIQFHGVENRTRTGNGGFDRHKNTIHLIGKLSVVTFLNCFARARGMDVMESFRWSLSIFKKMFPVSYSNCHAEGLFLIR